MSDYLANIRDLPVMPEVASKILGLGRGAGEISFTQLEEIIKVDVGLTAKILKIANSALYARQREISDLRTAITMLGFKNIKTLVLLVTASGLFHSQDALLSGFLAPLHRHRSHRPGSGHATAETHQPRRDIPGGYPPRDRAAGDVHRRERALPGGARAGR